MAILKQNSLDFISNSLAQTERLGVRLGQLLQPRDLICLVGELGAGKTALARGIARGWGTAVRVTSPTFTIVNQYPRATDGLILAHLDGYRLERPADALSIGLEDILEDEGPVMIEWAERVIQWLPADRLQIGLEYVNNTRRNVRVTAEGVRSEELMRQFKQAAFGV